MRVGTRRAATVLAGVLLASCATQESASRPAPAAPAFPPRALSMEVAPAAHEADAERWTGVVVEPVTEALATALGLSRVEGLYVREVEPGSPAERAGVRAGDVLLLAAGRYLGRPEVLPDVLAGRPVGSSVDVALRRGGDLLTVSLSVAASPAGRLMTVIQVPRGLVQIAAEGAVLYAYGTVPGAQDRGIVPLQLPAGPLPPIGPRAVASPGAERVIAADAERIYLGWAASEVYIDYYEVQSGRVGRLPVRGAESLANRCRAQGLTRVGPELWMACQRSEGPAVVRIDLGSGAARIEPLPATYWGGLAFDGAGVLWLCCAAGGRVSLSRTDLASGATKVVPLPEPVVSIAADQRAVYLLGANGIFQHKPWR